MYAIVEIAGQQFKVEKDKKLFVHQLDAEAGDSVDKAFINAGILKHYLYDKNVGLIPYVDDKCFVSGQRAIEFAKGIKKDKYSEGFRAKEVEYNKMKLWSSNIVREYINDKQSEESYKRKGCLFLFIAIILIIFFGFRYLIIEGMSIVWFIGISIISIFVSIVIGKKRDSYMAKYKNLKYYIDG